MNESLRTRLRACRSFLLTPGSRPADFAAARVAGDDGIITVAVGEKGRARDAALAFVRMLRINSPHSLEGLRDLLALRKSGDPPDAVVVSECEPAEEIWLVAGLLDSAVSKVGIVPMVELARAVFVAHLMADAHERVCGLFLGGGDLRADLGAEGSRENLLYARSRTAAAAATSGVAAIDVPYFGTDGKGLRSEATAGRKLGMTGKAALHSEQLAVINAIFKPSPNAVLRALSLLATRASNGASRGRAQRPCRGASDGA